MPLITFSNIIFLNKVFPSLFKELAESSTQAIVAPTICFDDNGKEIECWRVAMEKSSRSRSNKNKKKEHSTHKIDNEDTNDTDL